jgi:hypothetical protein
MGVEDDAYIRAEELRKVLLVEGTIVPTRVARTGDRRMQM